jgi:hypothetical protein
MQSLALDVHNECRDLVVSEVQQTNRMRRRLRFGPLLDWVMSPVGSGGPARPAGPVSFRAVSRSYRIAVATRLVGAAGAAAALVASLPLLAIGILLTSVMCSGYRRYRDSLEPIVTFRARYLSCLSGHFGDTLVLGSSTFWAWRVGAIWWPAPVAMAVMFFMTIVRTGSLQVGVFVPRIRLDRVVRIVAMSSGVALVALGYRFGLLATLAVMTAMGTFETARILREVWNAGVTEFAWMTSTPSGYVSRHIAGPLPDLPSPAPEEIA